MQLNSSIPASVFRRIAAFLYDSLLLVAIFFVVTAFALYANDGVAIEHFFYKLMLLPLAWIFFGWFWVNGGQTLGMRAWRIKLVNNNELKISWRTTLIRFVTGFLLFGITLLYAAFNNEKLSLHDRLSRTRVIQLKKDK